MKEPHEYNEFRTIHVNYREYSEIVVIRWRKRRFQSQPDLDQVWKRKFRAIRVGYCILADSS